MPAVDTPSLDALVFTATPFVGLLAAADTPSLDGVADAPTVSSAGISAEPDTPSADGLLFAATLQVGPLPAMAGLTCTRNVGLDEVTVSWTATPGANQYTVYRYEAIGGNLLRSTVATAVKTTTSHTFTGLDTTKSYAFLVEARHTVAGTASPKSPPCFTQGTKSVY